MFKKVGTTILVASTIAFGGAIHTSAAAADQGEGSQGEMNAHQDIDNQLESVWGDVSNFLENCFSNWEQVDQEENQYVDEPNVNENVDEDTEANEEVEKEETEGNTESSVSAYAEEVVQLTNAEREKQGLAPLEIDEALSKVALEKSKDMAGKGYFDHNSPTYGSPFDMMKSFDINYQSAGENIAKGQQTPEEVVDGWMNSEGHRENILSGDFTHIGVGYEENGNHWTQMFIGK